MGRSAWLGWALVGGLIWAGCSALVDPDADRLGGGGGGCAGGCDDGVSCTVDSCQADACVHTPDHSLCSGDERCDLAAGCLPASCSQDSECSDGLVCNGVETCEDNVCVAGEPIACDDGIDCTVDSCDEMTGTCVTRSDDTLCDDSVPCTTDVCGATGCSNTPDDNLCNDGVCFAGGTCTPDGCVGGMALNCEDGDDCTADMCDPASGMCVNTLIDGDMDGYAPLGMCAGGDDCDDGNGAIYPGAEETCNMQDDDCDGRVDEGACMPTVPDTCETAQELTVVGASVSISADFDAYTLQYEACAPIDRDGIFYFDLAPGTDYIVDTEGSTADTVLAASDTCGDFDFAGGACNDDMRISTVRTSRLFLRALDRGGVTRIYLLVGRYSGDGPPGNFRLNVRPIDRTGRGCSNAMDIRGGGAAVGYISEDDPAMTWGRCASADFGGREHFYRSGSSESMDFEVTAPDSSVSLYAANGCNFFSQLDCDRTGDDGRAEIRVRSNNLRVAVDGSPGFYTLTQQ